MAVAQFLDGVSEEITDIRVMASKYDNARKTALIYISKPKADLNQVMSFRMRDEEGEITCRDIRSKHLNGKFIGLEISHEMISEAAWDRFYRFMKRLGYAS
ncbi:photosystem II reaction center protein Psb28 [Gloeobacter kilaueensis]|uniref:Photosystem II reaction center Psb28 protein n=1 Tax=Gloeobacter kilaueensis (strain ATCC BAA-2537 / CCAP 1431/1 / ULC 316 / JS1) TaxID=1183438 RepID=U5QMT9_GLOK1|nr:photosystem II reaction center protein Psb28 [Gloeobacter kilaueensis]AGY60218.1 photosystem II reaction center protein Psb28 [Gloeobacter kilaueensis JS1]